MPNDWALITKVEQVEREKKGYELLVEDKIKCGGCDKPLVSILKVKNDNIDNLIKVHCPFCKDTSFKYKITGKIYLQSVDGISISNVETSYDNDITHTEIYMVKNE